jgi:hypothetical protein
MFEAVVDHAVLLPPDHDRFGLRMEHSGFFLFGGSP